MLAHRRRESADSSVTTRSIRTDTTWRYSVFGPDRLGRGPMLFTGPDGIRDHQVAVEDEHRYVGEGTMSPEGTSEVDYLWRAARGTPFPRPKTHAVGEVGWGIPQYVDWGAVVNGRPIRLGEFRQAVEDRHTHLYQNAWYPGPDENLPGESNPMMVLNVYQPRASQYDRYGRRVPNKMAPKTTRSTTYGRHIADDTGYHSAPRAASARSDSTSSSRRSVYSHYSDSFSRPKSALPQY